MMRLGRGHEKALTNGCNKDHDTASARRSVDRDRGRAYGNADAGVRTQGEDSGSPGKMYPAEPISWGLIVNFTARTVTGFRYPTYLADFPVAITAVNEVTVTFAGSRKDGNTDTSLTGTVDRITGDLQATYEYARVTRTYSLKCKPTQRMF